MNSDRSASSRSPERPLLHGVDWAVRAGVAEEIIHGTRRRVRQRRQRRLALGGALACAVAGVLWFADFARVSRTEAVVPASVVVSVPARQTLPDGTEVELKEGAEISVSYSSATRRVALVRGEAHFQVRPDAARPFIVAVDSVEVRAVGTAFSVQRGSSQVEVLVTHGRVAVDLVGGSAAPAAPVAETIAMLEVGNRALVEIADAAATRVEVVAPGEITQRLAWRSPRLEFTRTPLSEALPMINEHSAVKVSLADASLGSVQISGLLRANNVESLFRLLEAEHGIRSEQRSPTHVVLRAGR